MRLEGLLSRKVVQIMTQGCNSTEGKTLAELQNEIDLGMNAYPSTNHDVIVARWKDEHRDRYVFLRYNDGTQREKPSRVPPTPIYEGGNPVNHVIHFFRELDGGGGILVDETDTYETFQELLEDWPSLASQPIWSTGKTLERKRYEKEHAEKINQRDARDERVRPNTTLLFDGKPVIVGKTLAEIGHLVDAGQTLYAHTGKLGVIQLRSTGTGKYAYEFEFCRSHVYWRSEEGDNETLEQFLSGLSFRSEGNSNDSYALEMKELLTQPVWSNVDEQIYHMLLETPEQQEQSSCDKCPGINSFKDQLELCKDCADSLGQMAWDVSTERRELHQQFKSDTRMIRDLIKRISSTYSTRYPTWQYADSMCKELAATNWEMLLSTDETFDLWSEHPF